VHLLIGIDDDERLTFVQGLAKSVNKPASQDAYVYATVAVAQIQLRLGEFEEARKQLDECEQILEGFDSVETVVHAAFYKANAEYYKVQLPTSLPLDQELTTHRPNMSLLPTTRTLSSSLPVSTSQHSTSAIARPAPTISASPP
jgi:ATP/maltotriose-dependent transcriptional regulator MalT